MGRNNKHKRGARNKRGPVRSERRPSLTGRVQLHEHSAYVVTENGDYKVMGRGKREIMDGDTVAVSIKNSPHGERRAVIEGVVERAAISVVGTYQTAGPLGVIEPLDSRLKADFFILPEDTSADRLGVHPGDAVVARILTYPTRLESGTVTIERRIGGDDAPDLGVQYVMARYGYTDSYPEAALDEAEGFRSMCPRRLRTRSAAICATALSSRSTRSTRATLTMPFRWSARPRAAISWVCISPTFHNMWLGTGISILRLAIARHRCIWPIACFPCCPNACPVTCARFALTRTVLRLPSISSSMSRVACGITIRIPA